MKKLSNAIATVLHYADELSAASRHFAGASQGGEQAILCQKAAVAVYRLARPRRHPDLAALLWCLAAYHERAAQYDPAENALMEAIGIVAAADACDQRLPSWYNKLARLRGSQGKVSLALQAANAALALNERLFGQVSRQKADTMSILGDLYVLKDSLDDAERCLSFARDVYVGTVRPDAPELLSTLERLEMVKTLKSKSGK